MQRQERQVNAVAKKEAFTLVEVMIAVVVFGLAISLGSISLNSYMQKLHLDQATTEFVAGLGRAGDDALRFSQRIYLNEEYMSEGNLVWDNSSGEFGRVELPFNARVTSVIKSQPSQALWYSGRGLPYQQVEFVISLNNRLRRVVLLPTGLVVRK